MIESEWLKTEEYDQDCSLEMQDMRKHNMREEDDEWIIIEEYEEQKDEKNEIFNEESD